MKQSERMSKIPGIWRHGFQVATVVLILLALVLDLGGVFPIFGEWLSGIWSQVSSTASENKETLVKWVSWIIAGIAAAIGIFFAVLMKR